MRNLLPNCCESPLDLRAGPAQRNCANSLGTQDGRRAVTPLFDCLASPAGHSDLLS
jgi:hypothetical protein